MDKCNLPLITFALIAYNQESYIREAVKFAIAQDYFPLEIILSDDASSDGTASIIREVAGEYAGPNQLIVNINDINLGIGAHVSKIFRMARGDLIIFAAGDDLSLPERTRRTVEFWIRKGRVPSAIFCGGKKIDFRGRELCPIDQEIGSAGRDCNNLISNIHDGRCIVLGACSAYTPNLISHFGDLSADLGIEDTPLAVRASLLGGIEYIDETLVRYRVNVSVWRKSKSPDESFVEHLARLAHLSQATHLVFRQILIDTRKSGNTLALASAKRRYIESSFINNCCSGGNFSLKEFILTVIKSRRFTKSFLFGIAYSNPKFHRAIFNLKNILNNMFR